MEEKKILAKIQHPFTCKLIKAFQDSLFVYLLMEYVQGGELFSLLHSDDHHERGFPEEQAKFYSFCLADVFAYIHRSKIVFRDLVRDHQFSYPQASACLFSQTSFFFLETGKHHD